MISDSGFLISRFHSLGEFDDGKRSCRKRLADHNRRRRKPQPNASTSGGAAAESIGLQSADDDPSGTEVPFAIV